MANFKDLSKSILSKILFGFLVLSFVLFGISSFLLQGSDGWVAKINGKKISRQKLEQATNYEKQLILNQNSQNKDVVNYVNSPKFKADVLGKIINEKLIESLSERYGVYPDRIEILTNITKNTNFHRNGKFSHKLFKGILSRNGIDEETYINMIANETINTMVLNSLTLVSPIDQNISRKITNLEEEIRYADLITVSERNIKKIKRPSKHHLMAIYQENKSRFQEPEKRNVRYIAFDRAKLAKGLFISNKKAREFYNTNKEKFQMAQKRDFYHILFDEKPKAESFLEKLSQSKNKEQSFIDLGKKLAKKSKKQLLIKNITNNDSIPEVANQVFKLNLAQNSEIFESDLGYHIVLLKKIKKGEILKFSKAREEIKKQLQEKLISETIQVKIEKINESLLSSNSLDMTAKKFRLGTVKNVYSLTFKPRKSELNSAKKARKLEQFVQNAFKIQTSKTSALIEDGNNLYAILVTKVTEPRLKTYQEVRRELRLSYYQEKKESQLKNLTKEISEKLNKDPGSLKKLIKIHSLKVRKNKRFTKAKKSKSQGKEHEISTNFLQDLFNIETNRATNHYRSDDGRGFKIAILRRIKNPKLSFKQLGKHRSRLSESYRKGFIENFNKYIEEEHDLTVNQKFINSLSSNPTP